jgi:FdhE protein
VKEDTTSRILKKLEEQEKEAGNLPLLLEFYRKLMQLQSSAQKRLGIPEPGPSREALRQRIQQGQPLLSFEELSLDWASVTDVFAEVVAAFARYPQLFGDIPERLQEPGAGRLLTRKIAKTWFTGQALPPALPDGISENLFSAMIQATLQPFLAGQAKAWLNDVDQESWRRGYCPICGGVPDFSFLDKERGSRWLLCSRCDTAWVFQRLECPYCGNKDQDTLACFTDDDGLYRLYVCEKCQCYLKAIDLRQAKAEVLLPLERLYTIDLDKQAREHGYNSCQKPAAKRT